MRQASRERGGAQVAERLRERRSEIERATLIRVYAISEPPPSSGPEYAGGLRAAVSAGVDYGLRGIECGEQGAPPVPDVLLSQARLAARSRVNLDTVLRRYFAGHTLLEDFIVEEAERKEGLGAQELKRLLRSQAVIVDRLLAAVSSAYEEEAKHRSQSVQRRREERIERLLDGEPLDTSDLPYGFKHNHVAIVASGPRVEEAVSSVAGPLDVRLLTVQRTDGTLWAWLGSRRRLDPAQITDHLCQAMFADLRVAVGEPGEGMAGWRLSHHQARAALSVAQRRDGGGAVRYGDVALVASMLNDDLLVTSLRELYLTPLTEERDGGTIARRTLRAYFDAGRNMSSAAAALGVSRQTVGSRLRSIEDRIGRPLSACATEIEAALSLVTPSR